MTRLGLWGGGTSFASRDEFIAQLDKAGVAVMVRRPTSQFWITERWGLPEVDTLGLQNLWMYKIYRMIPMFEKSRDPSRPLGVDSVSG
jgi:hypothetical protein